MEFPIEIRYRERAGISAAMMTIVLLRVDRYAILAARYHPDCRRLHPVHIPWKDKDVIFQSNRVINMQLWRLGSICVQEWIYTNVYV